MALLLGPSAASSFIGLRDNVGQSIKCGPGHSGPKGEGPGVRAGALGGTGRMKIRMFGQKFSLVFSRTSCLSGPLPKGLMK